MSSLGPWRNFARFNGRLRLLGGRRRAGARGSNASHLVGSGADVRSRCEIGLRPGSGSLTIFFLSLAVFGKGGCYDGESIPLREAPFCPVQRDDSEMMPLTDVLVCVPIPRRENWADERDILLDFNPFRVATVTQHKWDRGFRLSRLSLPDFACPTPLVRGSPCPSADAEAGSCRRRAWNGGQQQHSMPPWKR